MTKSVGMRLGIHLLSCVFVFTAIGFSQNSVAQGTCIFRPIPTGEALRVAMAINDVGAVVGAVEMTSGGVTSGFLSFNGKATLFTFPGDSIQTFPNDINNHAQIVGSYDSASRGRKGFFVHPGGFQTISVPNSTFTNANGINDKGDIVGVFATPNGGERSFLLHNGHFTSFRIPGSLFTNAFSINNNSQIVGTFEIEGQMHGFLVRNGVFTVIDFPGAFSTELFKINNEGDMVGRYRDNSGVHGFALDKGRFVTIDQPNTLNGLTGVNNRDQVLTFGGNVGDCLNQF